MILNRKCEKCGKDNHVIVKNKRKSCRMYCFECGNMEYIVTKDDKIAKDMLRRKEE